MRVRYAILCPGQGGQHAGMFDLVRQHPRAAAIMQQFALEQRLQAPAGGSLSMLLEDDTRLFANRYAQPLIVAAGLAAWHCIGDVVPPPALVAGYSVGELTAYSVAGMWSATTAIDVAVARAGYMDACLQSDMAQGMLAVSGIAIARAAPLLAEFGAHVAIETGVDSLIAGGYRSALLATQERLGLQAAHCVMLPVGIASHTPLMAAAQVPFAALLEQLAWQPPTLPLLAGVSAMELHGQAAASAALLQQLTDTIQWAACLDACAEHGISVALELGPGSALSRMLRERQPQIECRSLSDFRSLGGALQWLQRRLD
jgi:[acyl-carrier-protein] S-malonyltransferase